MTADNKRGPSTSAMLLICGDNVDPDEIVEALKTQPWRIWKKGERKSFQLASGETRILDSINDQSGVKFMPDESTRSSLNDQLEYWAAAIPPWSSYLKNLRDQDEEARIEINCCIVSSETVTIYMPPEEQQVFSDAGVAIEIAFFPR
jgi:hypothetical protein